MMRVKTSAGCLEDGALTASRGRPRGQGARFFSPTKPASVSPEALGSPSAATHSDSPLKTARASWRGEGLKWHLQDPPCLGSTVKRGRVPKGWRPTEFPEQLSCGQHLCFLRGLDFSFGRRLNYHVLPPGWGPKLDTPSPFPSPHTLLQTPGGPHSL